MYGRIEELRIASREGDGQAKEALLGEIKPLILSSIRSYYNRKDLYEDLIQEGYEIILRAIEDYDPARKVYFLGYVKVLLKYHYLNKNKEKPLASLNMEIDESGRELIDFIRGEEDLETKILARQVRKDLMAALDSLTQRQKKVAVYFYIYGLSIEEIAEELGIAYRTVVNTKVRAIEKLRLRMVK